MPALRIALVVTVVLALDVALIVALTVFTAALVRTPLALPTKAAYCGAADAGTPVAVSIPLRNASDDTVHIRSVQPRWFDSVASSRTVIVGGLVHGADQDGARTGTFDELTRGEVSPAGTGVDIAPRTVDRLVTEIVPSDTTGVGSVGAFAVTWDGPLGIARTRVFDVTVGAIGPDADAGRTRCPLPWGDVGRSR